MTPPSALPTSATTPSDCWALATVLVVDDEPGTLYFLGKALQPRVGQVFSAESAEAADARVRPPPL